MSGAAGVGHLSIGEVLSLVQQDFPDVTISKIRFLESQGLIAPERTAAGYRKFYDSDIERLRWILRQQRDHFLPLKVIRKMLDQGVDVSPDSEAQPTLWSAAASGPATDVEGDEHAGNSHGEASQRPAAEQPERRRDEPTIDVTDPGRAAVAGRGTTAEPARPEPERAAEDLERSTYRSQAHPAVASSRPRATGGAAPAAPSASPGADRPSGVEPATDSGASAPDAGRPTAPTDPGGRTPAAGDPSGPSPEAPAADSGRRPAHSTPADVVAALQEEPRVRRRARIETERPTPPAEEAALAPEPSTATARSAGGQEPDVRMTRSELCEAAGIEPALLTDLEQFGLVQPTVLGGDPQYDGDALEVAKVAARYAELGVGARHLRMYKVAAEREAGFVEQLVVPLLKQRNPAAREQAVARADELQRMGSELHASLLRRRLGPSFGS